MLHLSKAARHSQMPHEENVNMLDKHMILEVAPIQRLVDSPRAAEAIPDHQVRATGGMGSNLSSQHPNSPCMVRIKERCPLQSLLHTDSPQLLSDISPLSQDIHPTVLHLCHLVWAGSPRA